ncbi:hypothetical protein B0J14DRAFT_73759 [Halenospora varia]|nr:hypothetical protein B0J14DRAFT_73759 [Halenospora varia]
MDLHEFSFHGSQGQWMPPSSSTQHRQPSETQYNPWADGLSSEQRLPPPAASQQVSYQSHYGGNPVPNFPLGLPGRQTQIPTDFSWIDNITSSTRTEFLPSTSKSPSFANILQPGYRELSPDLVEGPPKTRKTPSRRGQAHPRIHPNDWNKYKEYLKDLYIEKHKTTVQIKEHMKDQFKFNASEQQFKNKFSEWGFFKTLRKDLLPQEVSQWIIRKQEERGETNTEFRYRDRIVPIERLQEAARKAGGQNAIVPFDRATPIGLTYATPAPLEVVPSPFHSDTGPSRSREPFNSYVNAEVEPEAFPFHLRSTWKGYSKLDLENMIIEAEAFNAQGKSEEAEHKFLEALAGFENLFSPCNEKTVSLAYLVAEFYAKNLRMNEADGILERVGKSLLKRWGFEHSKTITHFLRVLDLYHAWSREDDAHSLLLRAIEFVEDSPAGKDVPSRDGDLVTQWTITPGESFAPNGILESTNPYSRPRLTGEKLLLINFRVQSRDESAGPVILDLIKQCERFPGEFSLEIFKSYSSLLDLYTRLNKLENLRQALDDCKACVFATLKKRKREKVSIALLQAAISLVGHFAQARRYKDSESILALVEKDISTTILIEEPEIAIECFIAIGSAYQTRGNWKYARPRFEHALAIALATRGEESPIARRLQSALENRKFSAGSLTDLTASRPRLRR